MYVSKTVFPARVRVGMSQHSSSHECVTLCYCRLIVLIFSIHCCDYCVPLQSYPELDLDDLMVIDEKEREERIKVSHNISHTVEPCIH